MLDYDPIANGCKEFNEVMKEMGMESLIENAKRYVTR